MALNSLGIIGVGKIGEAICRGLLEKGVLGAEAMVGSVKHEGSLKRVRETLPMACTLDNKEVVARCPRLLLLAVKPQKMGEVLAEIQDDLTEDHVLVSVAAGVTTAYIEERVPNGIAVLRAMPNTPCLIRQGMTALCAGRQAGPEHLAEAEQVFRAVGRTVRLDEEQFDAVTGLSGSGPAYMYVVLESLSEAGVKLGLPRDVATLLAAQTMAGAASMVLEKGEHPALLKDVVTTPAGCTIDGLLELEEGKLRVTLIKAVVKAAARAGELNKG